MRLGLFDSGIGGLTVLREIWRQCPGHSTLYLGDTARVPYGTKTRETVKRYAFACAKALIDRGAETIVVACNTASAHALEDLKSLPVPVIGVVEPGARAARAATHNRQVGVLGTPSAIRSRAYEAALLALDSRIETKSIACPMFVPLVEEGWEDEDVAETVARKYLSQWIDSADFAPDTIILGCTHYPLLKATLSGILGEETRLVDSAEAVASELASTLKDRDAEDSATHELFLTDGSEVFTQLAERWFADTSANATLTLQTIDLP